MTRTTNARVAGATFLLYIALGLPEMVLFSRATRGQDVAAQLASIAQHATDLRIAVVLTLLMGIAALVLGVTLYAITRDQDPDLAMLALVCRVGEGVIAGIAVQRSLALLWLATGAAFDAQHADAAHALGAFLLGGQGASGAATFFAVGSTIFAWLLLRGRMIPAGLAWLGLLASALAVLVLPLSLAGFIRGRVVWLIWLPMAAFEIPLALWFLVKGVAAPSRRQPARGPV